MVSPKIFLIILLPNLKPQAFTPGFCKLVRAKIFEMKRAQYKVYCRLINLHL